MHSFLKLNPTETEGYIAIKLGPYDNSAGGFEECRLFQSEPHKAEMHINSIQYAVRGKFLVT